MNQSPDNSSAIAASVLQLTKTYGSGDAQVQALAGVDVEFRKGQFTAVMGPSGSGKSTLMHCVAGLDSPTSGMVLIGQTELSQLNDRDLTLLRRDRIGFIFQAFNLVPTLTAEENILLPLAIAGRKPEDEWYQRIVRTVGLNDRLGHKPAELSGGQQQRVACARALVGRPEIIFADEPTGNLDSRSSAEVLAFLRRSVDEFGQTIVMVTHDPVVASYADRALFLADGRIVADLDHPTRESVLAQMSSLDPGELVDDSPAVKTTPDKTTVPASSPVPDQAPESTDEPAPVEDERPVRRPARAIAWSENDLVESDDSPTMMMRAVDANGEAPDERPARRARRASED